MTVLTTERLVLRQPNADDTETVTAFYQTDRSQYVGGPGNNFDAFKQWGFILGHWTIRGYGLWAVTEKGSDAIIGLVGPFYPDGWPETEIGWLMFDGFEGKGYAFEAAEAALVHARDTLGWTDIVHYISHGNDRSVALAERVGASRDASAATPLGKDCLVYRQPQVGRAA